MSMLTVLAEFKVDYNGSANTRKVQIVRKLPCCILRIKYALQNHKNTSQHHVFRAYNTLCTHYIIYSIYLIFICIWRYGTVVW